jgi:hypothetical protein
MATKKSRSVYRSVYRVVYNKHSDKWVMTKVLHDSQRFDSYRTKAEAQEVIDRNTRIDIGRKELERKEASRQRIVAGIQSLTPEDLTNLRDWFVALLQLRR